MTIQAGWRGHLARKKYGKVRTFGKPNKNDESGSRYFDGEKEVIPNLGNFFLSWS